MPILVDSIVFPPFMENSYVAGDPQTGEALLVDPGGSAAQLEALLRRHGLTPKAIVCTHGHVDHVAGVAEAQSHFQVPVYLHEDDRPWIEALPDQAALFGLASPPVPQVEHWMRDGDLLTVGSESCEVIHTPGHTAGGCCLFFPKSRVLLTGDTLFVGSIGRTDLPGGSMGQLTRSIRERLFPLGDDVTFYAGHGEPGTLGEERRSNPFVGTRG